MAEPCRLATIPYQFVVRRAALQTSVTTQVKHWAWPGVDRKTIPSNGHAAGTPAVEVQAWTIPLHPVSTAQRITPGTGLKTLPEQLRQSLLFPEPPPPPTGGANIIPLKAEDLLKICLRTLPERGYHVILMVLLCLRSQSFCNYATISRGRLCHTRCRTAV